MFTSTQSLMDIGQSQLALPCLLAQEYKNMIRDSSQITSSKGWMLAKITPGDRGKGGG